MALNAPATSIQPDHLANGLTSSVWDLYDKSRSQLDAINCEPYIPEENDVKRARAQNTTIVIACVDPSPDFAMAVEAWLALGPMEVIIITILRDEEKIKNIIKGVTTPGSTSVKVISLPGPDARLQKLEGFTAAKGEFTIIVDDGVFPLHDETLEYLLAPFNDPKVGAVGGRQM